MKKVFSIFLCFCIVFVLSACTSEKSKIENPSNIIEEKITSTVHETNVPEGYIGIYTIDDFEYIRTNPNYNYILMNDIDFGNVSDWKNVDIKADFDGNNYSIINYKNSLPLFANVYGIIWDFSIKNADVSANAILCDRLLGTIDNCSVSGNINYPLDSFMLQYIDTTWNSINLDDVIEGIGGIVSETNSSDEMIPELVGCNFDGNINIVCDYESISSKFGKRIDSCFVGDAMELYVGGVVGYNKNEIKISTCKSAGKISLTANKVERDSHVIGYIGGITGIIRNSLVENSVNEMSIDSKFDNVGVGGIAGLDDSMSRTSQILCCSNSENINIPQNSYGFACAGGIVGKHFGYYFTDISNCYNSGNIVSDVCGGISGHSAILHYCYNVGDINGNSKTGALLGEKNDTVEYCYYLQMGVDVTGDGGKYPYVKALTSEEMMNQNSFEGFDFDTIWKFSNEVYNYPTLNFEG